MTCKIKLSTPLGKFTNGELEIDVTGNCIKSILDDVGNNYKELVQNILDENGNIRKVVAIFINNDDIRSLSGVETKVDDGDELFILATIAGG